MFAPCDRFAKRSKFASFASQIAAHDAAESVENCGCRTSMMMTAFDEVGDWKTVDRNLRDIAARRAALDADEARWLREAERLQIWRPLGMVSAIDYMERVLGYTPHAALERLRVARSLEGLPLLEAALDAGDLSFSAVRELTRVATLATEAEWRDRALDKNLRQIEELVAGHARGDHPDDPKDPNIEPRTVKLLLLPEVFARLRQVEAVLADEHGGRLDNDALVTALCEAVLGRDASDSAPTGRAKFQILMTVCSRCKQGHQEGSGAQIAVDAPAVERALCDAQHIGSTSDPTPVRAEQDIPPSVVRFVWRRDGGRCQTPGCRSARGLEIHHIEPRAEGGSHDASNLRIQCSACHMSIHRGTLLVNGDNVQRPRAPTPERTSDRSHVGSKSPPVPSRLDDAIVRTQARDALVGLGWKPHVARTAVEEAMSHVGRDPSLEGLIREALRRCPRPGG